VVRELPSHSSCATGRSYLCSTIHLYSLGYLLFCPSIPVVSLSFLGEFRGNSFKQITTTSKSLCTRCWSSFHLIRRYMTPVVETMLFSNHRNIQLSFSPRSASAFFFLISSLLIRVFFPLLFCLRLNPVLIQAFLCVTQTMHVWNRSSVQKSGTVPLGWWGVVAA
jgi:hypothetical protein